MTDPLHASRHALAKIARMAGSAPPGLPFLRGIERVAREAIQDPAAELDADIVATARLVVALADYAPDVDAAAMVLDAAADDMPTEDRINARRLAEALRDLVAGLRLTRS